MVIAEMRHAWQLLKRTVELLREISAASKEQTSVADQINRAVDWS
jgi:methyl-accepting chemotaxis protein